MLRPIILVLALLSLLALTFGCSDTGGSPSIPPQDNSAQGSKLAPLNFIMEFNQSDFSVAIRSVDNQRDAQFDVTQWADIQVYNTEWVPSERNWYVSAQLKNTTSYKGYGVWTVFTELGQKELRDIDGFIYYGSDAKRVPFIALSKDNPLREFPGYGVENHTFVIHWPDGVNSWAPIEFYIDAAWPNPRKVPMVEDLQQVNFTPPCYHYAIRAKVIDFQSPSSDISVYADLSSYGGSGSLAMFDDGQHSDLEVNDGIFGAEFPPGSIFGTYTFTVSAKDPEGHTMENDLFFAPIEFPPMPPVPWETIAEGSQSGIHDEVLKVIQDDASWTEFWGQHGSNSEPPPVKPEIDFTNYMVAIVMLGARTNGCFDVEIINVDYSSVNCGIMVDYQEIIPEPNCACTDVITYPYQFIKVPRSGFDYGFQYSSAPLVCDEDCLQWSEIQSGAHCAVATQKEWVVTNYDELKALYFELFGPDTPLPSVDFDQEIVLAMTYGQCNSSGYYIKVDDICLNPFNEYETAYWRMIPGQSCMVLWVLTTPYMIIRVEKPSGPEVFSSTDLVYECN